MKYAVLIPLALVATTAAFAQPKGISRQLTLTGSRLGSSATPIHERLIAFLMAWCILS